MLVSFMSIIFIEEVWNLSALRLTQVKYAANAEGWSRLETILLSSMHEVMVLSVRNALLSQLRYH
jgi:hypothetical protein